MTGVPHTHRSHVPGCHRCELSRDEALRQEASVDETLSTTMRNLLEQGVVAVSPPYGNRTSWALLHMGSGAILTLLNQEDASDLADVHDGGA